MLMTQLSDWEALVRQTPVASSIYLIEYYIALFAFCILLRYAWTCLYRLRLRHDRVDGDCCTLHQCVTALPSLAHTDFLRVAALDTVHASVQVPCPSIYWLNIRYQQSCCKFFSSTSRLQLHSTIVAPCMQSNIELARPSQCTESITTFTLI